MHCGDCGYVSQDGRVLIVTLSGHPAQSLPISCMSVLAWPSVFWNFSPVWSGLVYPKCHCSKLIIFSPFTSAFFFRLTSGTAVSLSHRCLAKLLFFVLLLLGPALPICNQKRCVPASWQQGSSQVGRLMGRVRRELGSVSHPESRWAGEGEPGLAWEGKRGLLDLPDFSCCFCSTGANTAGLRSKFLYHVLIPPIFCSVTFHILENTFPDMFLQCPLRNLTITPSEKFLPSVWRGISEVLSKNVIGTTN